MTRHLLVLLLGSLATGCGGSVAPIADSTTLPDGGGMTDSDVPNEVLPGTITGSYDITFNEVTVTPDGPGSPSTGGMPPSTGAKARLDLRPTPSGGYEAVITSRWGDPSAFTVKVTSTSLTLEGGSATVRGTSSGNYGSDSWTTLTFPRAVSGGLGGAFAANGDEQVSEGDEVWDSKASAKGTLTRDLTPPETKPIFYSNGPSDALLPWDPIRVRVAEPTNAPELLSAFAVNAPDAPAAQIDWTIEGGTTNADWAGAIQAKGVRKNWDPPPSGALLTAAAVKDLAGNSSMPTNTPVSFLSLATGQTSHGFDSDVMTVASWGASQISFLGGLSGSDPSCEQGGCVKMGTFQATVCGAPRIGLAGLIAKSATKVVVRYRFLVSDTLAPAGQPPPVYGVAFAVDVANPGVEAKTTVANVAPSDLKQLGSPVLGMSWATDWTTLEAPAPASAPTVGFTVRAGANPSAGCGGPAPAPIDVILLIDSVDAT